MAGNCSVWQRDDKSSIPIGPHDAPAEAVRRQKKVLDIASSSTNLLTTDHDHVPQHIVPSVTVEIDTEKDEPISFYSGKVHVSLKCAIYEPSTALRHAAEFRKLYLESGKQQPYVFQYSDGGGDHNNQFVQVQLSYIALALNLGLDGFTAARTPPYLSVLNPAERVMATLNLSLYGVALGQSNLTFDEMHLVKGLTSKNKWRLAQEKETHKPENDRIDYAALSLKASKEARDLITSRLKAVEYGEGKVNVYHSVPQREIDSLYDQLNQIDDEINWTKPNLSKSEVMKGKKVQKFYKDHINDLQYFFQFKKCSEIDCEHCFDVSDLEIHKQFGWFPAPKVDEDDSRKFCSFQAAVLKSTTEEKANETCRPSAILKENTYKLPKAPFKMEINRARRVVICRECNKGRILFSTQKLTPDQQDFLDDFISNNSFVCGSFLIPEDHPYNKVVYQIASNCCTISMTALYFSAFQKKVKGYLSICSYCQAMDDYAVENDNFKGLPRCESCKLKNVYVPKRMQKKK